ncbi:MAG: DUF1697 domain-containing protein [Tahibacter sp.]
MSKRSPAKFAAFFRNLNLGRTHCPDRPMFESAFLAAGADSAQSFLTNGTMVFVASSTGQARKVLTAASEYLAAACGLKEPAYLRDVEDLREMVRRDPFSAVDRAGVYDCYISFLHPQARLPSDAPWQSARRDVTAVHVEPGEVFSVVHKVSNSPGSPNAWLEKMLGLPATTRAWNTIVRLVQKHT